MKKLDTLVLLAVALGIVGCSHSSMRGTVAMKVSDREGHVCLGDGEVKPGTPVAFYESVCKERGASRLEYSSLICKKVKVGEGEITQTLNEHYSVVRADPGVLLRENLIVETIGDKSFKAE